MFESQYPVDYVLTFVRKIMIVGWFVDELLCSRAPENLRFKLVTGKSQCRSNYTPLHESLFSMKWTRSAKVPYPAVWHRFQAKAPDSNEMICYTVEDLTEERYGDAIQHMCDHFTRDELMNQAKRLARDLVAMNDVVTLWKSMLPDRLSLICFRETSDEVVGVNILDVVSKFDKDDAKVRFRCTFSVTDYPNKLSIAYSLTAPYSKQSTTPSDMSRNKLRFLNGTESIAT